MNLAIIILGLFAIVFAVLSAVRFFFYDRKITPAIKTWLRVSIIFFIVCIALLIL